MRSGHFGQSRWTGSVPVETTTLDDHCRAEGIDRIDILKMDAQGSELDILRGGERLLSDGRVRLVYTELIFVPVYEKQPAFHEIASYVAPFGFRLFDFFGFTYDPSGQLNGAMQSLGSPGDKDKLSFQSDTVCAEEKPECVAACHVFAAYFIKMTILRRNSARMIRGTFSA